jgi:mono/diheme cytochrome c family protein
MKPKRAVFFAASLVLFSAAANLLAQSSNGVVATAPVYVPDLTHENDPMPDGVLSWNSIMMTTNLPADAAQAHFLFAFTNISPGKVSVVDVHPSCGCTTAKLPNLPWTLSSGESGTVPITVNVEGKTGTFFKSVRFATDKGMKQLLLQITIEQPFIPNMSDADRARAVAIAKIDRQAVFHNDCASCHFKNGEGKYGKALFDADCAICHEAQHRATFVADLHNLKVPTNPDFWRTWISHGKPGSFMPAFAQSDGGPLNDMQVESLAVYLNAAIPSRVAPAPQ